MIAIKEVKEVFFPHPEKVRQDGTPYFIKMGRRIELEDGVSAFYSYRFHTISVTYPGGVKTYNSGTPVHDLANRVVMNEDRKNKGIPLEKFITSGVYAMAFVALVLEGIQRNLD